MAGLRYHFKAQKPKRKSFTPFRAPTRPPAGTYDPALDSQGRAASRGLLDLTQDTDTQNQRALSDLITGKENLTRQKNEGLADLLRQRQGLDRSYGQLGNQQLQGARAAGVSGGGALVQAARKRAANEAWDTQPIATAETRLKDQTDRQIAAMGLDFQRGGEDRTTALTRAQRENTFFGADLGEQKLYQAKAGGYVPPSPPAGEYSKGGLTYHTNTKTPLAKRRYTLPTGKTLGRSDFVSLIRSRKKKGNPGLFYG